MKAIRTRYSGPTNTRGSRIHATDGDGNRVTVSYQYQMNTVDGHEYAAYSLMRKMGWNNELAGGGFGRDQYWVMLPRESGGSPAWETYFDRVSKGGVK
jgi:hypothetical protein